MTRRRGVAAADDAALVALAGSVAPVCTLVGKTWTLHLDKLVKVDREENLRMIAESIAFLRSAGKRVIYDAEHYFDGYRAEPDYALACIRAAADAGAETVTLCDTNGSSLPSQVSAATSAAIGVLGDAVRVGIHCHNDAECARRQLAGRGRGRRASGPGHDERLRRANRQRQPRLDHRQPAAQARFPLPRRRAARPAHRDGAFRRRAAEHHPRPQPAVCRTQRLRPQGRHARRRRERRRRHLRAHRAGAGRQPARRCWSPSSPAGPA